MISEEAIGRKIREIRRAKGVTLQVLAERTEFTKGYLSKLEHSDKGPPVSTLMRIARALGVTVSDILEEQGESERISVVKPGERVRIARSGASHGYHYASLAHKFARRRMDPYLVTRPPRQEKQPAGFRHQGHELIFMLQGRLELFHGGQRFLLEAGDCAYFDASLEHYGNNLGEEDVQYLMVTCSPDPEG